MLINKIYREKLYFNRNRIQNTFCKIISDVLNEQSLNKKSINKIQNIKIKK